MAFIAEAATHAGGACQVWLTLHVHCIFQSSQQALRAGSSFPTLWMKKPWFRDEVTLSDPPGLQPQVHLQLTFSPHDPSCTSRHVCSVCTSLSSYASVCLSPFICHIWEGLEKRNSHLLARAQKCLSRPLGCRKDRFPSARSSPRRAPPPGALLPSVFPASRPSSPVGGGGFPVCVQSDPPAGLKPEPPCTPRPPAPGCPRLCCLGAAQTVKGSHQRNSSSQERAALDPKLLSVYRAQQGARGSVRGGAGRLGGLEGVPRTLAVAFSYPYV